MKQNRLLLLLALLMTVATGAWAVVVSTPTKHTITAVYDGKTITKIEALPYEGPIGAVLSAIPECAPLVQAYTLTNAVSSNTNVVAIGTLSGWATVASVKADGSAKVTLTVTAAGNTKTVDIDIKVVSPFSISLKDGTKDADKWAMKIDETHTRALPVGALDEGDAVTLVYQGSLKVKSVKATSDALPWDGDLAKLTDKSTEEYATATNGMTIYGTLSANVKVRIADGATVTLDGVTINGTNNVNYKWAGITCQGGATIILKDGTTNTVKGFFTEYPGILAAVDKTLIIKGTGSLNASSGGSGAAIGGGQNIACGNIEIQGGDITATGGYRGAAIGGGYNKTCGTITISGGTVVAQGGYNAAGIGSGDDGSCGDITISGGTVNATAGNYGAGIGSSDSGGCGNITISGGTVQAQGGYDAAGIGTGFNSNNNSTAITISGGTVEAHGGIYGAGIGSGDSGSCGNITITADVTSVTATKGNSGSPQSIGAGNNGSCGSVSIADPSKVTQN